MRNDPNDQTTESKLSKRSRALNQSNINFIDYELMFERAPVYETFENYTRKKSSKQKSHANVSFYQNPAIMLPLDGEMVPDVPNYESPSSDPHSMTNTPSTFVVSRANTNLSILNTPEPTLNTMTNFLPAFNGQLSQIETETVQESPDLNSDSPRPVLTKKFKF
jgi:hypothetical protein